MLPLLLSLIFSDGFETGDLSCWSREPCDPCVYKISTATATFEVVGPAGFAGLHPEGEPLVVGGRVLAAVEGPGRAERLGSGPLACRPVEVEIRHPPARGFPLLQLDEFPAFADWRPCQ